MKDYLNSRWWMEGMPCKEDNGQCVLSVGGVGSKPDTLCKTHTGKNPAPSAKEPVALPQRNSPIGQHESSQNEFGLRDVLRSMTTAKAARCPGCGGYPVWDRAKRDDGRFEYRIRCQWNGTNWDENPCIGRITPWLPSLEQAIHVWSLAIELAK
jgi:hypothetical protein